MAVPQNKTELLDIIRKNYRKPVDELESIPTEIAREKTLEGHAQNTRMSICDLLAYLVGWGEPVLKWERKKSGHEAVDFPETGYKWNELGKLAGKFYQDYRNESFAALKTKLTQNVSAITNMIENKSEQALYGENRYEKYTLGRMIQFNTASPYANARGRIRKWKNMNNIKGS